MPTRELTIGIAAYNIEDYISACLDSCILPDLDDKYEIIVVNDGSTDQTLSIVKSYSDLHPGLIKIIDKKNGGYGTAVNAIMRSSSARYVKLLDGDDEFDPKGLRALINLLGETDADWIVTDISVVTLNGETKKPGLIDGGHEKSDDVMDDHSLMDGYQPSMWYSTFKRELFEKHPFELPSRCLYTDTLFVAYQLAYAQSVSYLPSVVYRYRLGGREEQSSTKRNRIRHIDDELRVWDLVLEFALDKGVESLNPAMMKRVELNYWDAYSLACILPSWKESRITIRKLEKDLEEKSSILYRRMDESVMIRLMRKTKNAIFPIVRVWRLLRD